MATHGSSHLVEAAVFGIPKSSQGRGKTAWRQEVTRYTREQVQEHEKLIHIDVRILLIFFHIREFQPDLDNVVKPTLDGFADVALGNDNQVAELIVRRTRLEAGLAVQSASAVLIDAIVTATDEGRDFVYIRASDAPINHRLLP